MTWTVFISVAGFCVAAGALATAVWAFPELQRLRARYDSLESSVAGLRREVELLASISARSGRRVQRVEHDYSSVAERLDALESLAAAAPGAKSLDQAIESARRGADAATLTEQFGLSGGEAELVARLHGRKKSA